MKRPPDEGLPPELQELADTAEELANEPELARALHEASRDPALWHQAETDAQRFLAEREIALPPGLTLRFLRLPDSLERPAPDYYFFTIRLTKCRTYWLKKRDEPGYEAVEICWGFEIAPHPLPPIA